MILRTTLQAIATITWLVITTAGCERANASHCWNRSKDVTCEARGDELRFCSPCVSEHDGCVADPPGGGADCSVPGPADTGGTGGGTLITTSSAEVGADAATTDDTGSDTGPPPIECGNGVMEGSEVCDGEDLGGLDCSTFNGTGTLACNPDCTLDTSACTAFNMCGDGIVMSPEQCDGDELDGMSCADIAPSFPEGELTCSGCTFNTTACCKPSMADCSDDAECCSGTCTKLLVLGSCD
jgi:hypothetical protein